MDTEDHQQPSGLATCRKEVLELGHIPVCPWLSHLNSLVSLQSLLKEFLRKGQYDGINSRCFVTLDTITEALGATLQQTQVLLDLLAAVTDDNTSVQCSPDGAPVAADAHRLVLFLFVQYYTREASRADTADVWPSDHPSTTQIEPSSPMRLAARSWAKEQAHHRAHMPQTRQKMQEHLIFEESVVNGLGTFIAKHAADLVALAAAGGPTGNATSVSDFEDVFDASASEMDEQAGNELLKSSQIDKLGFLISVEEATGSEAPQQRPGEDQGPEAMDVCASGPLSTTSPFMETEGPSIPQASCNPASKPLSQRLPPELWQLDGVPAALLAAWLRDSLTPPEDPNRAPGAAPRGDVSMYGASPPRISMFDQLAPPELTLLSPTDVHGVHRTTALRGESDLSSTNRIKIVDCHDAIVYCLAPLQYATISCCSDCVMVLGAVAKAVRIERCERVQLVVAAQRVIVNTCHDCILYLAVNRPPLLLGDNRFMQLAPHNAGYDRLADHVQRAGVQADPKAWCSAMPLLPDPSQHAAAIKHHNALMAGGGSYGTSPPLNHMAGMMATSPTGMQVLNAAQGGSNVPSPSGASGIPPSLSPLKVPGSPTISRSPPMGLLGSPVGKTPAHGAEASAAAPGQPPTATLLPAEKLVPFLVPFTGGEGPLCGGPARTRTPAAAAFGAAVPAGQEEEDPLAGMLGGAGGSAAEAFGPSPFPLPQEFASAWEERMSGMAAVRQAYRQAGLDDAHKKEFIGAVQAHFKEWLQAGSGVRMREVYDLARAEKEGASSV